MVMLFRSQRSGNLIDICRSSYTSDSEYYKDIVKTLPNGLDKGFESEIDTIKEIKRLIGVERTDSRRRIGLDVKK